MVGKAGFVIWASNVECSEPWVSE